ncbi:MAG: hypothetical protein KAH20_12325 [Methylococcales bacterium]|nr:hypothetical protein [Methylococcales bacterium]
MKKITFIQLSVLFSSFNSNIAIAADNTTDASFSGWPLLLLIALLIIFRKKIFSGENINDLKENSVSTVVTKPEKKSSSKKTASPEKKPSTNKAKTKASSSLKDISDDNQCQASTAKGTRCKRTTTLEKTTTIINNKSYKLTVCSQHNNKNIKPFSDLIK